MSNSVFLKPDENGNWGKVGTDATTTISSLLTLQSGATGTGNGTVIDVGGYDVLALQVTISATAAVTFEATVDGTTWSALQGYTPTALGQQPSTVGTGGIYRFIVTGIKLFRARISSYTSGTIDVTGYATKGSFQIPYLTNSYGNADTQSATSLLQGTGSYLLGYNGSTWDRIRNNLSGTVVSSNTRTSTISSSDITNFNHRGIILSLNITAASGTGGLQVIIQMKDALGTVYKSLNTAPTAVTAIGQYVYMLYPAITSTNGAIEQVIPQILPQTFRVQIVHGDSSSYTYSMHYQMIL